MEVGASFFCLSIVFWSHFWWSSEFWHDCLFCSCFGHGMLMV
ncbi:hypothetical protein AMTRI_Chr13g83710 [Amborella trichopoda]